MTPIVWLRPWNSGAGARIVGKDSALTPIHLFFLAVPGCFRTTEARRPIPAPDPARTLANICPVSTWFLPLKIADGPDPTGSGTRIGFLRILAYAFLPFLQGCRASPSITRTWIFFFQNLFDGLACTMSAGPRASSVSLNSLRIRIVAVEDAQIGLSGGVIATDFPTRGVCPVIPGGTRFKGCFGRSPLGTEKDLGPI
jgi:hypothetical protein